MKVAIYTRVSTVMQADKDSLPMQKKDLEAYSEHILHCKDFVIFEDAGYSGKNMARPAFQEMMGRIRKKEFSHLLVWKIDRISRNLLDFATMYAELKDLGVAFVSQNEQFDTSTAMGEAMLKIILVFAELERNMTSERVKATMNSRAGVGQWNGGRIPYGYRLADKGDFVIDAKEGPVVARIFREVMEGHSMSDICRRLNDEGTLKPSGKRWAAGTLGVVLHNQFYTGSLVYNMRPGGNRSKTRPKDDWVEIKDHHPAIVSREDFLAVRKALADNARSERGTKSEGKYVHVFLGKLYCKKCGRKMSSNSAKPDKTGLRMSVYLCQNKNVQKTECKNTSDAVTGEFFINYLLHIVTAQAHPDRFQTPEELQAHLLQGLPFDHIDHIERDGLESLFRMIKHPEASRQEEKTSESLDALKEELKEQNRALYRLERLYLYDDRAIPVEEYIVSRAEISAKIQSLKDAIEIETADLSVVTDRDFLRTIGAALLGKEFSSRNYVSFKNLYRTLGAKNLQNLVDDTTEMILIDAGKVAQITFRNGLTNTFVFR